MMLTDIRELFFIFDVDIDINMWRHIPDSYCDMIIQG